DDHGHAEHYSADLVLNQNLHAAEELYRSREPTTRLLLGTRYVLLRREFRPWGGWQRPIPEVARKVLITLGGADPDNVTLRVISAFNQLHFEGLQAVVLVGSSNPHLDELITAARTSPVVIRLESNVNDMAERMAWADAAITASGTTAWERAV